jgi:AcrR family transcriptional regulator
LPPRAHRTRLDPEVRRELILDAAERVLVDRIPTEVTFEEIADAAEVSRGLVYNYFRDRTALLVALAERALERLDRELVAALDPGSDLPVQIAALGRAYGRHARTNGGTWRLLSRAGLLDHPSVQSARAGRVARIAAEWGDTPDARLAAWSITALFELTGVDDLPFDTDGEDLTRFLRDVVSPALTARGVGPTALPA